MLRSNNPAVHNENHPENLRPRLNPYDPANGYNPDGLSTYSDAFKKRYFEGQSDRLNHLIAEAQDIQFQIDQGTYPYPDNAPLCHWKEYGCQRGGAFMTTYQTREGRRRILSRDNKLVE